MLTMLMLQQFVPNLDIDFKWRHRAIRKCPFRQKFWDGHIYELW